MSWSSRLVLPRVVVAAALFAAASAPLAGQTAQVASISEEIRTLDTYPFSEPNPVPILIRDPRLYPYHSFEGYSATSRPQEWKVVKLENDYIEVFVLPEVGGKVWGAIVKETGHEFIYRNEVMKFRNIALRGPWTSGGIEFNFGVIGHTPSTASPVDYTLVENPDGSVSCWVGSMDLPSRTHWRVEIRLPADRAYFETNVFWYNPTPLEQPYYNWMTAAAFAQDDLEMSMPGDRYLQHSGQEEAWPVDEEGRYLPLYGNNTFEGHKSYHVVGELNDFFGGYYHDEDYGFGHWARYEDMPGQKLWLWALSREGGVWDDLLTDTDGQYVEFQAGRLFVQYSPGAAVNPITQAGFDPMSASRWTETWFPLEGIGGLTDASRDGAMFVSDEGGRLTIRANAFRDLSDTLKVWSGARLALARPVILEALKPYEATVDITAGDFYRVEFPGLGLDYDSDPAGRLLDRPFSTDSEAFPSIPDVDRGVFQARELLKGRRYAEARDLFEEALEAEPWNREALLGLAELAYRSGSYGMALDRVNRARQLDAYDAEANFLAGTILRALGRTADAQTADARTADARDAFGWAARSVAYRSAAYAQLAEIMIGEGEPAEATRHARMAIDFDRYSVPGWRALSVIGRKTGDEGKAEEALGELLALDPLHHFVWAERYLAADGGAAAGGAAARTAALAQSPGGEYPDQTLLELAIGYEKLGLREDAVALLNLATEEGTVAGAGGDGTPGPASSAMLRAWRAWLTDDPSLLVPGPFSEAAPVDPAFAFPYRPESLPVLKWAARNGDDWVWTYLLALNLWAMDREEEAASLLEDLGQAPDFGPLYVARAHLLSQVRGENPQPDLRRAVELAPENRILHIHLIRDYQDLGAWDAALAALDVAHERFSDDFNLALFQARALINVGRALEATRILDATHVLPSENSRESHRLYEQAHTLVALDALDAGDHATAKEHLMAALEWPESLGQGRPYDPEERLVRFLLGRAEDQLGHEGGAQEAFQAVVDATGDLSRLTAADRPPSTGDWQPPANRLDLLAIPSLHALGRTSELEAMGWASAESREFALRLGTEFPQLFGDLEGRLLLRALALSPEAGGENSELYRAPAISNVVDGVIWEAGNWEPHLAAGDEGVSWGNHRAVVAVEAAGAAEADSPPDAVRVTIPWRRRDADPASKGIIVVDAATGEAVRNALATRIENASGDVVFRPNPGSAVYHAYYLPWQSSGGYYPTITYPTPERLRDAGRESEGLTTGQAESPSRAQQARQTSLSWAGLAPNPDPAWEARVRNTAPADLPEARTTHIQSVDQFHSFFPMEVIATPEETAAFMAEAFTAGSEPYGGVAPNPGWALVWEHRDYPIRMRHFLPRHWADRTDLDTFTSQVLRDEAFTFQLAVVSGDEPLSDVRVSFHDFPPSWLDAITCFNCEGIDERGLPFTKDLHVAAETFQPLWIGVRIPEEQPAGTVEGSVTVSSGNRGSKTVRVSLEVKPEQAINGGADDPELMTRLAWLNSTGGTDPDFIIEPFEPVTIEGHILSILGRRIELGPSGLPDQIFSYFTPELTHFADEPEPILALPLALEVRASAGQSLRFEPSPFTVRQESRGRVRWTAENTSDHFTMTVDGTLEYDGMLDYRISLVALADVAVDDIALPISMVPDAAEYMLGLGRKGGKRPAEIDWKWAVENHQEGVWLGGIHKGLQYVLRDDNYARPLNTNFYQNQPLNMPPSWFNEGLGGIRIASEGGFAGAGEDAVRPEAATAEPAAATVRPTAAQPPAVTARNYSGPRTVVAGDTLHFNIRFLITPFKPTDTGNHFNTRFVHQYVPVDSVRAWGGTVVNIHHANEINPYINYPFYNLELQKAYIDEAHEKGIKVKLYNTIRELTYKAHELYAVRSLGDEILNDGEGGGHSWMQEHMESDYHSAWHAWRVDDAAMLNKGTSRWTNYYIEGLSWLAENQHIDGLYLDDIAFSRETVKRLVTVMDEHRDEVLIDLHSANQFNVRDGFINSAMLYMEHFPFISRLWFGEYFEYDLDEDYWMTEVSGLPFGLMGEMLQDGGHPYRGMLYGMTARKYGDVDPMPVWAMMNDFGIGESRMLGYWLDNTPVTTNHPRVLATTYVRPDAVLIALASWAEEDEVVSLSADWEALGFGADPRGTSGTGTAARAYAPAVEGLQEETEVDLSAVRIPAGQGLFVVLRNGGDDRSNH